MSDAIQDRATLTAKEREHYASLVPLHPIAAHQREQERARAAAFPRLLAAYSGLDTALAEGQGYCEELSQALAKSEARVSSLQKELAQAAERQLATDRARFEKQQSLLEAQEKLRDARLELGEQEREKLALIRELPPEGDGGLWALQRLADYASEAGHMAALFNIRAAAHNLGWCIDSSGTDEIVPTVGICPLCDCDSTPRPPALPAPVSPSSQDPAGAGEAWVEVTQNPPFAFVPYIVAALQHEGQNKGKLFTLNRTCLWDSIEKQWVRHGVTPRSVLNREVTHYRELPAPPEQAQPYLAAAPQGEETRRGEVAGG